MNCRTFKKDLLTVKIYENRDAMGIAAAEEGAALLRRLLSEQDEVRVIFAAAPSQNEFLASLCAAADIDWSRVTAFHMDEYIGLHSDAPQGFGNFLRTRIFQRVPFRMVHYIDSTAKDPAAECLRYGKLLAEAPIDVVFMGIGENGHIAFNDPPVADFQDTAMVKPVKLDEICRNQQIHDGCFETLELVPTHAITLTVPTLANVKHQLCMVPAPTKAQAVKDAVEGPVSETCPASILRTCQDAVLYLEEDSAQLLAGV